MQSKPTPSSVMALGGILAALAVLIMSMGTIIPVGTYACPMLCVMILRLVLIRCGRRIAWAWYGAVAILSMLLVPDKEAAAVFVFLGYYPIIKPNLDRKKLPWLWKGILFNSVILSMYWILMHLMGLDQITQEFEEMGMIMTAVLLLLGNATFYLLDKALGMRPGRKT